MSSLLWFASGIALLLRYLFSLLRQQKCSSISQVLTTDAEQLAEIHGEAFNQESIFDHVERGLNKNPDGPAVVCLFQQSASFKKLVDACASGYIRPGSGVAGVETRSKLWCKQKLHTPFTGESNKKGELFSTRSENSTTFTLTYTELHRTALKVAAGLISHGAQPYTTMLMLIPNSAEYTTLMWVCILLRITYVNMDPASLDISGFTALKHTLQTIKPQIVVVPDAFSGRVIDVAVKELELPQPIRVTLFNSDSRSPSPTWRSLATIALGSKLQADIDEIAIEIAARCDRNPNRINSIMFTSGTSGIPKGCPQSVSAMSYALHSQKWLIDAESGTARFAVMQPHNSRGIAPAQLLQTWRAGGAVVLTGQNFSVVDAVHAIRQVGATFLVLTPPMVHEFAIELAARPLDVSSVKRIQVGGDAVTKDVLVKCAALFPQAQVCVNHGMTEGPGAFKWPFLDMSQWPEQVEKISSLGGQLCPVGVVAPGSKIRICSTSYDNSNGGVRAAVRRNELGELHISCPSIIKHYLGGRSEESFYNDSTGRWFNTGDMAMVDTDGLVFIVGRRKDMIQCAGGIIAPAVIESCVAAFTKTQTIVVPTAHHVLGAEPCAVVDSFADVTAEQIKDHVRAVLGREYALGGVVSLKQLGFVDFPVNATHKIIKSEVQAAVARYQRRGLQTSPVA